MFAPRPMLQYLEPSDHDPAEKIKPKFSPISQVLEQCNGHDLDYVPTESFEERRKRIREEKKTNAAMNVEIGLAQWDPASNPRATKEPYNTLFVGRLNYETTEDSLAKEFGRYGPLENVCLLLNNWQIILVRDKKTGKSRGYAFVQFSREKDMQIAFKDADGMKIHGRRIVVDVERGRTVKGWIPRRLGGGLGKTRVGSPRQNQRFSGRDVAIEPAKTPVDDYVPSHSRDSGPRPGLGYRGRDQGPRRDFDRRDRRRSRSPGYRGDYDSKRRRF